MVVLQPAGLSTKIRTTSLEVLRFLALQALQALQMSVEHLGRAVSASLNAATTAGASTVPDWKMILLRALRHVSGIYVIVELDVLLDKHEATKLYTALQRAALQGRHQGL